MTRKQRERYKRLAVTAAAFVAAVVAYVKRDLVTQFINRFK